MAPLNLPPPALTLEEAQQLASKMETDKSFSQTSFSGSALEEYLKRTSFQIPQGKTYLDVGQALMEHRLLHHVHDDEEFNAHGSFRLISQESKEVKAAHALVSEAIQNAIYSGKIQVQRRRLLGLMTSYEPVFGVLSQDRIRLYKRQSAATAPVNEYLVKDMKQQKECLDGLKDWYCFTITMRSGEKVTLCADHSKRQEGWMAGLTGLGVDYIATFDEGATTAELENIHSIFELQARKLNSTETVKFSDFKGDVCLVVNVSTLCGLTPQYAELQTLYEKYQSKGLRILAFPVNQFANQEPGTEQEIAEFAKTKFNVTFDMLEKTYCNGKGAHPVFRFVKSHLSGVMGASVKWNFTKFLCDRSGKPVKRYSPTTTPLAFEKDIEELLATEAPK